MPTLNFKKQFIGLIESGLKNQTIRSDGKRKIKQGDKLYLYTGLRTKHAKKIKEVICKSTSKITIDSNILKIDESELSKEDAEKFYKADGFNSGIEFLEFFLLNYNLPFYGILIKW